jgi:hypothetical protein
MTQIEKLKNNLLEAQKDEAQADRLEACRRLEYLLKEKPENVEINPLFGSYIKWHGYWVAPLKGNNGIGVLIKHAERVSDANAMAAIDMLGLARAVKYCDREIELDKKQNKKSWWRKFCEGVG